MHPLNVRKKSSFAHTKEASLVRASEALNKSKRKERGNRSQWAAWEGLWASQREKFRHFSTWQFRQQAALRMVTKCPCAAFLTTTQAHLIYFLKPWGLWNKEKIELTRKSIEDTYAKELVRGLQGLKMLKKIICMLIKNLAKNILGCYGKFYR